MVFAIERAIIHLFRVGETRLEQCCCADAINSSLPEVNHAWEILFIFMLMKLRDGYHSAKEAPERYSVDYS